MQQPLAIAVIGGRIANMLLTRVLIAVGYLVVRGGRTPVHVPAIGSAPLIIDIAAGIPENSFETISGDGVRHEPPHSSG